MTKFLKLRESIQLILSRKGSEPRGDENEIQ